MNILYVSRKDEDGFIHIDYLDECLLTGLKELYGNQVVDINKKLSNVALVAGQSRWAASVEGDQLIFNRISSGIKDSFVISFA